MIGNEDGGDGKNNGALEILLDLLDIYPELNGSVTSDEDSVGDRMDGSHDNDGNGDVETDDG